MINARSSYHQRSDSGRVCSSTRKPLRRKVRTAFPRSSWRGFPRLSLAQKLTKDGSGQPDAELVFEDCRVPARISSGRGCRRCCRHERPRPRATMIPPSAWYRRAPLSCRSGTRNRAAIRKKDRRISADQRRSRTCMSGSRPCGHSPIACLRQRKIWRRRRRPRSHTRSHAALGHVRGRHDGRVCRSGTDSRWQRLHLGNRVNRPFRGNEAAGNRRRYDSKFANSSSAGSCAHMTPSAGAIVPTRLNESFALEDEGSPTFPSSLAATFSQTGSSLSSGVVVALVEPRRGSPRG